MRHRMAVKQLSRTSAQRKALLRSEVTSLLIYERIVTTKAKALAVRRLAEKVVTRAKNANAEVAKLMAEGSEESVGKAKAINVHAHRRVSRYVWTEKAVARAFVDIAPLFANRNGGYTRILKLGSRMNDAAEMVILEFVERTVKDDAGKGKKKDKKEKKASSKAKQSVAKTNDSKVKQTKSQGEKKVTRQKKGGN